MPIQNASDSQKIDFLWKKIVYGAAKTDIAGNIDATQEPVASPLQIRADKILQDSASIPTVIPGSNSSVVTVYPTTFPVECISTAGIPTPTLTWQTGRTFWVPPEFGSTYQIKVYIAPSGNAANVASKGTQVFATGSGYNDLWVFDYQSGILNFNSNNTPYNGGSPISFTGNSVYISGAVYAGEFGLPTASNIGNTILGNITFSGNTISSNQANGNIMIFAPGTGVVQFVGQDAIGLPSGDDTTRPTYASIGYTRFNTSRQSIEYYDGSQWLAPGEAVISSQTINPDGSANTFSLSSNTTTAGVLVSINGTLQQPISSYVVVSNNQIQFTEVPLTTDVIEVRYISVGAVTVGSLTYGTTTAVALDIANVNVTGNLLPSANVTYDLGSSTLRWRTGYFSANTINIGGGTIGLHDTLGFTFTTPGAQPQYMMPNGASTSNTFTSSTVTIQGNLAVAGNTTVTGNVSGQYILGSGQFLSVLPGYAYSNVNVAAYTQTQSYTNYSNVNLTAYLGGTVTIGGNLTVQGNLFVNGNVTTFNANNLSINDSMIYLADDNPADTIDIGFVSAFTNAIRYQHTGLVRDATDGVWKLFANVVAEPTTTVDFTDAIYANLQIGNLSTINVSIGDTVLVPTYGGNYNNHLTFQSSTADDSTRIQVAPSGAGLVGQIAIASESNVANASVLELTTVSSLYTRIESGRHGSGTRLPLDFYVGGARQVRIDTGGNISMGSSTAYSNVQINHTTPSTSTTSGALQVAGGVGVQGNVNASYFVGTATTAQYADLAENYVADHKYVPGTVLDFGGTYEVTISNADMSTAVAGVVSSNPAYLMNSTQEGMYVVAVALQGRVQTRVIGPIRKGNMLVSTGNGMARAETNPRVGTVLGKALEDFNGTQGIIEIVVGVR